MYREYIAEADYVSYYEQAVQLSAVYLTALFEIYTALSAGTDFTDQRFPKIVSGADLSCPLDHDILKKTYAALTRRKTDKARYKGMIATGR